MTARRSWVLISLAGLALLAGCGKSEKDEYADKLKSISKQFETEQRQLNTGNAPAGLPEAQSRVRRLQQAINRWSQRLGDVKAPSKVKDLHARFTMLIRSFAISLEPSVQAADSGDVKRFQAMTKAFQSQVSSFQAQLATLSNEYKSRGYSLSQ